MICFAGGAYFSAFVLTRVPLPLPLRTFRVPGLLWGAIFVWMVVQALPLAPSAYRLPSGTEVELPQLSFAPGLTWLVLTQWIGYATAFVCIAQCSASRSSAVRNLTWLYWAIVGYAILGLVSLLFLGDTILGLPKWAYRGYATSTFVNRNSFATLQAFGLTIGTAFAVALFERRGGGPRPMLAIVAICLSLITILAALLASGSRMGLAAGVMGSFVVLLLAFWRRPELRFAAVGAIALLVGAFAFFGWALLDRVGELSSDFQTRVELYRQVIAMALDRPWTGYGAGAFEIVFQSFRKPPLEVGLVWNHSHSTYLALAVELGFLGLGLVICTVLSALGPTFRHFFNADRRPSRAALAAVGVLVVASLHSLVDFSLEIQGNAYFFIAVLATGFGYCARERQSPEGLR
jgi:O-antigen ligase